MERVRYEAIEIEGSEFERERETYME